MNSSDLAGTFDRAFPLDPIPAVLVPEDKLKALTLAARDVCLNDVEGCVSLDRLALLDRESEPFADMLDLDEVRRDRAELIASVDAVRRWLDAGCVTLIPIRPIQKLVESLGIG